MGGDTKTYDTSPQESKQLRQDASLWLGAGGQGRYEGGGGYGSAGVQPSGGTNNTAGPGGFWATPGASAGPVPVLYGPENKPGAPPSQGPNYGGQGPATQIPGNVPGTPMIDPQGTGPSQGGFDMSSLDPNAIAADPQGFIQWLTQQQGGMGQPPAGQPPQAPAGPGRGLNPGEQTLGQAVPELGSTNIPATWQERIPGYDNYPPEVRQQLRTNWEQQQAGPSGGAEQFAGIYGGQPALANPEAANVQYGGNSAPVNYQQTPGVATPGRDSVRELSDPNGQLMQMIQQIMGQTGPNGAGSNVNALSQSGFAPANLGQVGTQSIDQLGSATSGFFNNMVNNYQPAFTQARNENLASAKESLGSLTGSSAGNRLGTASNRSLGAEQAQLAELAKWGVGQEANRQMGVAGLNTQRDIAGAGINRDLTLGAANINRDYGINAQNVNRDYGIQAAGITRDYRLGGLDAATKVGLADQGADLDYNKLGAQIGSDNADRTQQTNIAQGDSESAASLQNQRMLQDVLSQISSGNIDIAKFNAGQSNNMSAQDAQNFLNFLISQTTAGVTPSTVVNSPGLFQTALGAGTTIGAAYLGGK